ncbi:MAG: DNA cytosine methyltransferase [Clostridia bacterium]|nr:DNA cytosine methyltransferase [Clostridia bacterium]
MKNTEIVVDNFAGGGGASTGIEIAIGRSVDIAINHDPAAIAMHRANHPTTKHYIEDVWAVDPVEACEGRPVALAWFSPDCKHHSKAKGGKPVDKNIRGLAWVAVKWAQAVHPRVIMLENVEEFMDWGPLTKDNRPDPDRKGETFREFVQALENCGYFVDYRLLRACDYGAPTIRKRFFLVARCDGKPIVWPEPTHAEPGTLEVIAGLKQPWVPVADVLDFNLPCPSIFASSEEIFEQYGIRAVRPLSEKTMRRIARGVMKFVINNPRPFIVQVNHGGDTFRGQAVEDPLDTITAKHGTGVIQTTIAPVEIRNNNGSYGNDVREPIRTITTGGHHMLATPVVVSIAQTKFGGDGRQHSVEEPLRTIVTKAEHCVCEPILVPCMMCNNENAAGSDARDPIGTITTGGHHMMIAPSLIQYHDEMGSDNVRGQHIEEPIRTVDASNRYGLVSTFISKYYGGVTGSSAEDPLHTVTAIDHNAVCAAYVTQFNNHCDGQSVQQPLNTVTAGNGHFGEVKAFLIKYYGNGDNSASCDRPAPTVTAKDRMGLVTIHGQDYQIVDIGLRMLTPRELFDAQGFPPDYIIDVDADGKEYPKAEQVARCGNAVCPPIPTALVRANLPELCERMIA